MKVNWPRPRLEVRLRFVGSPEEKHWRCELAGTKSLGDSRRSRVARRGKREFNRSQVIQKADQVYLVLGSDRADLSKPP